MLSNKENKYFNMRLIIVLLILANINCFSQDTIPKPKDLIYIEQINSARYPGGANALNEDFAKNLQIGLEKLDSLVGQKIYLKLDISSDGIISNIEVFERLTTCGDKAIIEMTINAIKQSKNWFPATTINGTSVNSSLIYPITFHSNKKKKK
jgi:hypothetical protein